jgi:hypothetical protein
MVVIGPYHTGKTFLHSIEFVSNNVYNPVVDELQICRKYIRPFQDTSLDFVQYATTKLTKSMVISNKETTKMPH